MPDAEVPQQPSPDLAAWDWRDELGRQDRDVMWLSRRSGVHYRTAYRLFHDEQQPTDAQLRAFARALGVAGPDFADL